MFGVCLYFLCYCCLCWGIIVIACCYSFLLSIVISCCRDFLLSIVISCCREPYSHLFTAVRSRMSRRPEQILMHASHACFFPPPFPSLSLPVVSPTLPERRLFFCRTYDRLVLRNVARAPAAYSWGSSTDNRGLDMIRAAPHRPHIRFRCLTRHSRAWGDRYFTTPLVLDFAAAHVVLPAKHVGIGRCCESRWPA